MKERRLRILRIDPHLLIAIAKTNKEPFRMKTTCEGLPADATVAWCQVTQGGYGDIELAVDSKDFPVIPAHEPLPFVEVRYFQEPMK